MSYKTIICPVDGSDLGDKALDEAVYLSKISGAKLILLHVSEKAFKAVLMSDSKEWDTIREGWLSEGREFLLKQRAKVEASGVKDIELVLRDGEVSNEVIAEAMEKGADVIVMASHRYSPVGKLFHGSTIDRVTKRSPCPILWVFK
ncbi:MAG: universal stress protein [Deltaproteobacteria bacterium]|nr:universal stress protein [Deltaproteobacteria bacterium]